MQPWSTQKARGRPSKGITDQEATVLTVMDIAGNSEYRLTNMGRISADKMVITVKPFTKKQNIEHHILNASRGERVKGNYHIQHINSLHSRMKNFFNHNLKGVSTKYVQKYLNWQKIKDMFNDSTQWIKTVSVLSLQRADANTIYSNIEDDCLKICDTSKF